MIKLNGHLVTPTIFPDGTSQVWKLSQHYFQVDNKVEWIFENEAELIHVCQLGQLLRYDAELYVPFLPYGRQDKIVSNETTFALHTFISMIELFFYSISTLDAHSVSLDYKNIYPKKEIQFAVDSSGCNLVCFPDKGAQTRYSETQANPLILDKVRDQSTGEITGLAIASGPSPKDHSILIVDDICDGGRTFIEAAKLLYKEGAKEVNLYTTHGLYTKGLDCLREAGIKRIFNYKGEV